MIAVAQIVDSFSQLVLRIVSLSRSSAKLCFKPYWKSFSQFCLRSRCTFFSPRVTRGTKPLRTWVMGERGCRTVVWPTEAYVAVTSSTNAEIVRSSCDCLSQCFQPFAAAEPHTSVKVTHGIPCIDSWVHALTYARLKLQGVYGLIFLTGQSPHGDDRQIWPKAYNIFDRISKQQYCSELTYSI